MRLNPYLIFNGQCEAAFKFYEECLGGNIVMKMTFGESPMAGHVQSGWVDKILHATFSLGDQTIGGADAPPDRYQKPQGFWVTINIDDPVEAERIFEALSQNGDVQMPIQPTFWAKRFGMVVDQFGTPWMINCGTPA